MVTMTTKITLEFGPLERITLSLDEARALYNQLGTIFGSSSPPTVYPPTPTWCDIKVSTDAYTPTPPTQPDLFDDKIDENRRSAPFSFEAAARTTDFYNSDD